MVYAPSEDSFLLKRWLEEQNLKGKKVLDVGAGSGVLAITAAEEAESVDAIDIDKDALEATARKVREEELEQKVSVFQSNLFGNVSEKYDLIIFNPPYLPGKEIDEEDNTWRGGEDGIETVQSFLNQVEAYLNPEGKAVTVISSLSDLEQLHRKHDLKVIGKKKLWFEELYLVKLVF